MWIAYLHLRSSSGARSPDVVRGVTAPAAVSRRCDVSPVPVRCNEYRRRSEDGRARHATSRECPVRSREWRASGAPPPSAVRLRGRDDIHAPARTRDPRPRAHRLRFRPVRIRMRHARARCARGERRGVTRPRSALVVVRIGPFAPIWLRMIKSASISSAQHDAQSDRVRNAPMSHVPGSETSDASSKYDARCERTTAQRAMPNCR